MKIKKTIKIIVSIFFLAYLKFRGLILNSNQSGSLIILYYHSINNNKINKFNKQIKYLASNFNLVNGSFSNIKFNYQNILITFDDALLSVKTNGLPILKKYRVPCIIFVPTGLLGKEPSWEVYREKLNIEDRIMSEQELLTIVKEYDVILGSHTHTHKDLKKVNENILEQELILSKKTLEIVSNINVNNFSFPYGSYNDDIIKKIINLGYHRIFSSKPEIINYNIHQNTFGRVSVNPEDYFLEYWLKVNGAYSWIPAAGKLKRYLIKMFSAK